MGRGEVFLPHHRQLYHVKVPKGAKKGALPQVCDTHSKVDQLSKSKGYAKQCDACISSRLYDSPIPFRVCYFFHVPVLCFQT